MGSLSYPLSAPIYIDANNLIFTIERVQSHVEALRAFWRWTNAQGLVVLSSEPTVLESLVGPLKISNQRLTARFRRLLFKSTNLRLMPVTLPVLERAARLRAQMPGLKTPNAIHAATALEPGAATFITNDTAFRQVTGLHVVTPDELPVQ